MTQPPSERELAALFAVLIEKTRYSSISTDVLKIDAGKSLIEYGEATVRYMFRRNVPLNAHTMCLLYEITGENPVPHEHAGRIELMGHAWRDWVKNHGYR